MISNLPHIMSEVEEYLFAANLAERTGRYKGYLIIVYINIYLYFCQYAFRFHPTNPIALPWGVARRKWLPLSY